jgi:hypothetical protein
VPFRVTVDVALDLTPSVAFQQMQKWLAPGRGGQPGARFSATEIRKRYARATPDPYRAILQQSDSLLLTRTQIESLQAAQTRYRARADSLWAGLADELGSLGDTFNPARAAKRQHETADRVWDLASADVRATLPGILTPIQLQLLPSSAAAFYRRASNRPATYFFP